MNIMSYSGTGNLGDAIQTMAVLEVFKKNKIEFTDYIDRKNLKNKMFINGWHRNAKEKLPYEAVFCSIHSDFQHLQQIKKTCFVGCRDYWTLEICKKLKLESILTGCVTINFPISNVKRKNELFIDSKYLEKNQYTQGISKDLNWESQLSLAKERLFLLSSSELVHTKRLHILIPCIAMGIPVILDDICDSDNDRFSLISKLVKVNQVIEFNSGIKEELLNIWMSGFSKILERYNDLLYK